MSSIDDLRARLSPRRAVRERRVLEQIPEEEQVGVPESEYHPDDSPEITQQEEQMSVSDINEMFAGIGGFTGINENIGDEEDIEDEENEENDEESIPDLFPGITHNVADTTAIHTVESVTVASEPVAAASTTVEVPEVPLTNYESDNPALNDAHYLSTYYFSTARFSGAEWFDIVRQSRVTIIGCGGIGSWTALMIARLCPKQIVLYDDDTVENINMAGQFFSTDNINEYKTTAVARNLKKYASYFNTLGLSTKFTEESGITDIVITCLDNMTTRRTAFNTWKRRVAKSSHPDKCLFIDGRLAAEVLQVFSVTGDDANGIRRYESTLFNDNEATEERCSYRQTSFMANMIGSFIANVFVNFISAKYHNNPIREIPFKIEYIAEAMYLKTEL